MFILNNRLDFPCNLAIPDITSRPNTVRFIGISLISRTAEVEGRVTASVPLSNVNSYLDYLTSYLEGLRDHYPLTNKSSISSTVANVILFSLAIFSAVNSSYYTHLFHASREIVMPLGVAKLISYVAVPTNKHSIEGRNPFVRGQMCGNHQYHRFSVFLDQNFRIDKSSNSSDSMDSRVLKRNNIAALQEVLVRTGFSITTRQTEEVIGIVYNKINNSDCVFQLTSEILTSICLSCVRLTRATYVPLRPSSKALGVYKFRTTNEPDEYSVLLKPFTDLGIPEQQILYIALHLFRPVFTMGGRTCDGMMVEDSLLDLSTHNLNDVLTTLFSFDNVKILPGDRKAQANGAAQNITTDVKVQHFSTLNGMSGLGAYDQNIINERLANSVTLIRVRRPLLINMYKL